MFGRRPSADPVSDAREAREMAIRTESGLSAHMHTCENNQHRIENEFSSVRVEIAAVKHQLTAQDHRFEVWKQEATRRFYKIIGGVTIAAISTFVQVLLHFLPTTFHF